MIALQIFRLPRPVQLALGNTLGLLWFDVFRIRRRVALSNLELAFPDWSPRARLRCARRSCQCLGSNLVEFALFPFLTADNIDQFVQIKGMELLNQALAKKKGVLILTLHLGNGDLAIAAAALKGLPVHLISKKIRFKPLNQLWFKMRERFNIGFISVERSSYDILRALKKNEIVIFVLDQFMGPPSGVLTRFFSWTTGTAAGLAVMADRSRAPVLPCYTFREPNGMLKLVFEPEIEFSEQGDRIKNISHMTQTYTDKLEEFIRMYPEQWMWIHRRWKRFGEAEPILIS